MSALRQTSIVGIGYTEFAGQSHQNVIDLAYQACKRAIDDAGMTADQIGAISTYAMNDSVPAKTMAACLATGDVRYLHDAYLGGQAPAALVLQADAMIRAGVTDSVLIYRAMKGRSGARVGYGRASHPTLAEDMRLANGLRSYPQVIALWSQRLLYECGYDEEDLYAVVAAQREYAALNARAVRREALSFEEYQDSPMVASPLRVADCTREVDGACAVVITRADHAAEGPHRPVDVVGGAYAIGPKPGQDMADVLLHDDYSRNCMHYVRERLWSNTGLRPDDIDVAEIYDCFSPVVLFALEGLGIVERGAAGAFVRDGQTRAGGRLPVNTHGGLLAEGYLHGMNTLLEAVEQLRGDAGDRTVTGAEHALVTSGALVDGSAVVLSNVH